MERFKSIDTVLNGNGHVGIKTHIFRSEEHTSELYTIVSGEATMDVIGAGTADAITGTLQQRGRLMRGRRL